jgi:hypothetical protein
MIINPYMFRIPSEKKPGKHDRSAAERPTTHLPVALETKGFKTAYSAYLLPPQCK